MKEASKLLLPVQGIASLVEEADDLACDVLSPRLLVVHDASGGGEDDVAELTGWQELDDPLLKIAELDVVAWGDDTGLVQAVVDTVSERTSCVPAVAKGERVDLPAVKLDDDLAVAVVVDLLELADVACNRCVSASNVAKD